MFIYTCSEHNSITLLFIKDAYLQQQQKYTYIIAFCLTCIFAYMLSYMNAYTSMLSWPSHRYDMHVVGI